MQPQSSTWDSSLPPGAAQALADGDPDTAIAALQQAVDAGDDEPTTLVGYGQLLWRLYRFDEAGPLFRRVEADRRAGYDQLRQIAHAYFQIGRFTRAAEFMALAVERLDAPDAAALATWAWTLERDNQRDAARQHAERAIALDPTHGPAVRLVAHLDRRDGRFEEAAARLDEQLRERPGDFDWGLRYELAAVYDRLGRHDAAFGELIAAKRQLAPLAAPHVNDSRFLRRRQAELVAEITPPDLRRWQAMGDELQPPRRIALLAGFPRSGTTLLEQMIAAHPGAVDTDESGILPGQFIEPLVWRAADATSAIIEMRSFDAGQLAAGRDTFVGLTSNYVGAPIGERLLVEKNPLLTADLALPLRLFPEALLVIALRDPRDTVLSYLQTMVPLNWGSAAAIDVVEACQFYADTMRHWLWWRERLEWPWREVRYEDVVADAEGELRGLAKFLGLSWHKSMVDDSVRAARPAVRTPTYDDVAQPLYTRSIAKWRNYERHLAPGLAILAPFVRAFGYEG